MNLSYKTPDTFLRFSAPDMNKLGGVWSNSYRLGNSRKLWGRKYAFNPEEGDYPYDRGVIFYENTSSLFEDVSSSSAT